MPLRSLLTLLLITVLGTCVRAENLKIVAAKGDGIYALLRKYQLLDFPCNLTEFYRLNKLKNNAQLYVGRTYELPISILTYNGKSIRTTTENDDYTRALNIQYYNEALLTAGVRSKDFREDKVLYVPFHIDNCYEAKLKPASAEITDRGEMTAGKPPSQLTTTDYRTFNIFGKDHAYVKKKDDKLAGRVFYIVSGHGGPDPGTLGKRNGHTLPEDEYAYDVALRVTRNILAHGGTPYMIVRDNDGIRDERYLPIDKDETVWGGGSISRRQKVRLAQRCHIINQLYEENLAKGVTDQTMISIHVDSRAKNKKIDLFFYHHDGDLIGAKQAER
ncbi:MAG: N-acetylmuramoyl-L-alanine amidase, partial [Bacteroidota bacterium]